MQPTPESTPQVTGGSLTPSSGAVPPVVGESFVDFVRGDRQRTAYILLGLAVVFLALCIWSAVAANKDAPKEQDKEQKEKDKDKEKDLTEEAGVKTANPHYVEYVTGAVFTGLASLVVVCGGGWLLVSIPPPITDNARQKAQARTLILAVFGSLGAVVMLAGGAFFYLWGESITNWLDKGQVKEAKFVIGPLLAIAVGGLLMFLAIQPARAEERDNRTLRQLIYGANTGLSVLLVLILLIVANVIINPRIESKLDVTQTGFYTLTDGSKNILAHLTEPMKAYAIIPSGGREADDIRRLLQNCEEASNGKLAVEFISPVSDPNAYRKLAERFPRVKTNEVQESAIGVLLTVNDDEKQRNSFIRAEEFFKTEGNPMQRTERETQFIGEARLMKEFLFLGESEKAVVYFTQSAGELDINERADERNPTTTARQLRMYLERNNVEIRPLKFDLKDPKVPGDASVLIVAGPQRPLDEPHVEAIRKYMTEPRPGNKKGKLIVLAGAGFGPPPKREVQRTGLEGLLLEFNVQITPRVVVGQPTRGMEQPYEGTAAFSVASLRAQNPIAMALGEKAQYHSLTWRPAGAVPGGGPAYRATPLLLTADRDRFTWLEDHRYADAKEFDAALNELMKNGAVQAAKNLSDEPRQVAVAVSEPQGDTGRVVVVGNHLFVSDAIAVAAGGEAPGFDLISGSVDWLRERPSLSIEVPSKKYTEFKFPAKPDHTRGLWLPLLLSITVVGGLGIGVWLIRRAS